MPESPRETQTASSPKRLKFYDWVRTPYGNLVYKDISLPDSKPEALEEALQPAKLDSCPKENQSS